MIGYAIGYARLMLKGRYCFQDQFVSEETGVVACWGNIG
jgi:hypothetical protein